MELKKEKHFIHVSLKVGHAYVTVADETSVANHFFGMKRQL
jgi:hypothetical protein